ncbi:LysR family transcriptional regulator [Agrobacterium vitis]|uniref:Transcriptional regulator LysR family n=2 Tax=Rhizobium/Agrobacterium group TaxID=227290 RepID=B9K3T0_ALLAM|nr:MULTISPECIES: LysR substrate-binding domain-containing protein [Rhizobium/Agrobacterium group]ACM39528.1 transcriptional regulator LysR family [Allorhizobium ampelinum S4]MCF1448954.1 LysR family transcriptional regulator [Allorhizobium ampelinum]MCF1485499.1 LysR family transcriptional regulator [Allorhizobium ampelinum]MUO31326.1 LysR family transcriptional regulator [Agrobacterium vitis]MUO44973.1 LysR family transcriptional regulator [Agrobacterium vitis]
MEQRKRRLPPLKSLLFLESVVRNQSVTAAADELSITHSAVSKQLSQLEVWIGQPLFLEKRKGMIPTAEIGRVAAVLGNAFDEIQDALDELHPKRAAKPPVLRVIAPATLAMRWLIPKLGEFHTSAGETDVMVRPTHTPDNWLEMEFDIAIRRGGLIPPQFLPQSLFAETLSLVATARVAESYRMGQGDQLSQIGLIDVSTRHGELMNWLKLAGLPVAMARQATKLPHFYIALDAMFAGRGALVVPTYLIEDQLSRGELVELFPQSRIQGPSYQVFVNPASGAGNLAKGFVDWIKRAIPSVAQYAETR